MVCQPVLFSLLTRRVLVKLLAAALCLAAVSVTGCATDDDVNQGGFSAVRPSKPSPDTTFTYRNPDVSKNGIQQTGMIDTSDHLRDTGFKATIISDGDYPLPNNVCDGCEVTLVTVPANEVDNGAIGQIDVMSDGGDRLCKIYLNQDGSLDTTTCRR